MYDVNGEARAAAKFGRIAQRDKDGRARVIELPGHNAARYRVILRHEELDGRHIMSAECAKEAGPAGWIPCNGNLKAQCYHSRAAVIIAAADAGYDVRFTKSGGKARKLKNFGDTPVPLYSWQNKKLKPLYVLMRRQANADQKAA